MLVGGVLVWITNGVIRWWLGAPLGHDEARYALDARDWLAGQDSRFFYSGFGMQLVGAPGILLGGSERALRFVPLLLGTSFLASAYFLARRACGPPTAAWTVAVLAGSRTLCIHGSELLSDLAAAACMLIACAILVEELPREDGPRWRMVVVGPLCAAAFYLRFGSIVTVPAIAAGFLLACYPAIARRPLRIAVAAALYAVLLVPHLAHSHELTGSLTGVLRASSEIPPPSSGFTEYMRDPFTRYGALVVPLMVIAIGAAPRSRGVIALQLAAVGQFVLLTLTSHAQSRFVYFATVLLVIAGVDALWRLVQHVGPRVRIAALVVALGAIIATWTMVFVRIPHHAESRARAKCASSTRVEWYAAECR